MVRWCESEGVQGEGIDSDGSGGEGDGKATNGVWQVLNRRGRDGLSFYP